MPGMQALLELLRATFAHPPTAWLLLGGTAAGAVLGGAAMLVALRRAQSAGRTHAAPARDDETQRDALTGLATRAAFEVALEEAVWELDHQSGAGSTQVAVLSVALDDLRSVNDAWGHAAGDTLLIHAARRLSKLLAPEGAAADDAARPAAGPVRIARVGGEEFALLLAGDEASAVAMAARVCATLSRPCEVDGQSFGVTASAGVAFYPMHGAWTRLLPHAAAAMRHVRAAGGNGHAAYAPAMAVDLRDQALLLQDLREAVQRGELRLLYQPKIDAESLQITAAEALLRWEHPLRGIIAPAIFIPLAERHGIIGQIGDWVVAEACRQASVWRESGLRMRIAINISGHQLRHDRFVAQLEEQVRKYHIPPTRLTCEITESVAMEDTAQTRIAFQRLRRAGFHVSIDDFGTGHSSLAVLRRLPAAELKVDRSFIVDLEASESARSIVEAVMSVARTLGLRVVAEGVETEGQRDILVQMGCHELQGHLFARPMSAAALALWAEGGGPESDRNSAEFRPSLFDATRPAPVLP
jgi:diguanylate cyclase (GGDEF)-like protein